MEKILILGSKGMLGAELLRTFGPEATGWDRRDCDAADFSNLRLKILGLRPEIIINCIAYNDVDGGEKNPEAAFKLNSELPQQLSLIANECPAVLVQLSTNYVFDGQKGEYKEDDLPHPLSVYGQSKYHGEQAVTNNCTKYYLIRTAVLFGPKGESSLSKKSFVDLMLDLSQKNATIKAVDDEVNSITYAKDLAEGLKNILKNKPAYGIYHMANSGQASWYDYAKEIFFITGKNINLVPVSSSRFPRAAGRPKKSVLVNTKLPPFRPWREALREFLDGEV